MTDEKDLFQQAMQGVTPLTPDGRVLATPPKVRPFRSPPTASSVADTLPDPAAHGETPDEFLRNGLSRMTLRKLRRGQFPIEDQLDLHGMSSDEARRMLQTFLVHATHHRMRCVNVIHGKGRSPDGGEGLLKRHTRHWLTQHPHVLAFCEPAAQHGGGGAVWVLLKSAPQNVRTDP